MKHDELLLRIARTLKSEIGPTVGSEYAKTQTYMAAVVLEKLGRELALTQSHAAAAEHDYLALERDLNGFVDGHTPAPVRAALAAFIAARDKPALCALIEALYADREALGQASFERWLGRVRESLRAAVTRELEYAK